MNGARPRVRQEQEQGAGGDIDILRGAPLGTRGRWAAPVAATANGTAIPDMVILFLPHVLLAEILHVQQGHSDFGALDTLFELRLNWPLQRSDFLDNRFHVFRLICLNVRTSRPHGSVPQQRT